MSDLEFKVLDELYFVVSFESLMENVTASDDELLASLKSLLEKKFIHQMKFDEQRKDFVRMDVPDFSALRQSSFVASKEGLLVHNSRG